MTLSALNSTTVPVVLVVNEVRVKNLKPGDRVEIAANALPPLPWAAEVRLPTGRPLLSLTIRAGDVVRLP